MYTNILNFLQEEEGVTAIEYGVIAALIIVVCIAAITTAGESLQATWETITGALDTANST